jgi:hypothetical protein
MDTQMQNLLFSVGWIVVTSVLLGLSLWRVIVLRRRASAVKSWPQTPGKVLLSEVERYEWENDNTHGVWHFANIEYEYTVNGLTHRGVNFRSGERVRGSERAMKKFITDYLPGTPVTVFYNPENPEDAVLNQKVKDLSRIMLLSAIFWLMMLACGVSFTISRIGEQVAAR